MEDSFLAALEVYINGTKLRLASGVEDLMDTHFRQLQTDLTATFEATNGRSQASNAAHRIRRTLMRSRTDGCDPVKKSAIQVKSEKSDKSPWSINVNSAEAANVGVSRVPEVAEPPLPVSSQPVSPPTDSQPSLLEYQESTAAVEDTADPAAGMSVRRSSHCSFNSANSASASERGGSGKSDRASTGSNSTGSGESENHDDTIVTEGMVGWPSAGFGDADDDDDAASGKSRSSSKHTQSSPPGCFGSEREAASSSVGPAENAFSPMSSSKSNPLSHSESCPPLGSNSNKTSSSSSSKSKDMKKDKSRDIVVDRKNHPGRARLAPARTGPRSSKIDLHHPMQTLKLLMPSVGPKATPRPSVDGLFSNTSAKCDAVIESGWETNSNGSDVTEFLRGTFKMLKVWSEQETRNPRAAAAKNRDRGYTKDEGTPAIEEDVVHSFCDRCLHRITISPSSIKHMIWELLGVIFIFFDLIWCPLQFLDPPTTDFSEVASWVIRIYWSLNIFVNFLTGYLDNKGVQVMTIPHIARRYLKNWLLFDIAVVFIDWVEVGMEEDTDDGSTISANKAASMLVMFRLLRVVRLRKFRQLVKDIRSESVNLLLTFVKIILVMLSVTHVIACVWYGIGLYGSYQTGWVKFQRIEDEPLAEKYAWSFHCVMALLSGEHVVMPRSLMERVFCTLLLFMALLIGAWFVSSITTAMTRLHIMASQKSSQFSALKRYLTDNKISRELSVKVQRNAHYALSEQKRNAVESSIDLLMIISDPLRSELHYEVYSPMLTMHPFFKCYADTQKVALRKICHNGISRLTFGVGDPVFNEGEAPAVPRFYMVQGGKLVYSQEDHCLQYQQTQVHKSDWLSEAVLWTEWSHLGTLKATTDVQMLTLEAVKFQNIANKFPSIEVRRYAHEFVENLCQTHIFELTDVGSLNVGEFDYLVQLAFPQTANTLYGDRRSLRQSMGRGSVRGSVRQSISGFNLSLPGATGRGSTGGRISVLSSSTRGYGSSVRTSVASSCPSSSASSTFQATRTTSSSTSSGMVERGSMARGSIHSLVSSAKTSMRSMTSAQSYFTNEGGAGSPSLLSNFSKRVGAMFSRSGREPE